jgi:hypothetical protein
MDPVRVAFVKERDARPVNCPISDGMVPVILLLSNHNATVKPSSKKEERLWHKSVMVFLTRL